MLPLTDMGNTRERYGLGEKEFCFRALNLRSISDIQVEVLIRQLDKSV